MNLYVIYDRVAEESGPVFEAKNDGVAARKMRDFAKANPVDPGEFKLLLVGEISHTSNMITVISPPVEIEWKLPVISQIEGK